ncbi:unnamed protein product [Prunus brigantina]
MASSVEARGAWTTQEDIVLCQSWVNVSHCLVTGNEMKFSHIELGKWRNALTKARENIRSGQNLSDEIIQAQVWFGAMGQGKKSFLHHECWEEVVKDCSRFKIILIGPLVV